MEELVENMSRSRPGRKVEGNLSDTDHKIIEIKILRRERKGSSQIRTVDFRKADFSKFMDLVDRIPCETV